MLQSRFDQNGLLRQTLLSFRPKNCGICCDKVSKTFSYECFCQNQRSRKSSSHLSSLKTSFIKTAIVKHLSNFTHFQILSKTSFTSHMFFSSVLKEEAYVPM